MRNSEPPLRRASLDVLARREHELRKGYLRLPEVEETGAWRGPPRDSQPLLDEPAQRRELVIGTARLLELMLALFGWVEAAREVGASTIAEAAAARLRIEALVRAMTGLDLGAVMAENSAFFEEVLRERAVPTPDAPLAGLHESALHSAGALLAAIPIERIERLAAQIEEAPWGHRARVAYDRLRAFVRRGDPRRDAGAHAAGKLYAEGRLSIDEVARLLETSPGDAAFFLEQHGYSRRLEDMRLAPGQAASIYAAMRADRLRRGGRPEPVPGVTTDRVIASQRIEDEDARPWLPPAKP